MNKFDFGNARNRKRSIILKKGDFWDRPVDYTKECTTIAQKKHISLDCS